jgi:hypothetical protein
MSNGQKAGFAVSSVRSGRREGWSFTPVRIRALAPVSGSRRQRSRTRVQVPPAARSGTLASRSRSSKSITTTRRAYGRSSRSDMAEGNSGQRSAAMCGATLASGARQCAGQPWPAERGNGEHTATVCNAFISPHHRRLRCGRPIPPHVMMQMLAAEADVAERPLAGSDAVGEPAQPGECGGEGQPAEQGGPLSGAELLLVCAAHHGGRWCEVRHTHPIPTADEAQPAASGRPDSPLSRGPCRSRPRFTVRLRGDYLSPPGGQLRAVKLPDPGRPRPGPRFRSRRCSVSGAGRQPSGCRCPYAREVRSIRSQIRP